MGVHPYRVRQGARAHSTSTLCFRFSAKGSLSDDVPAFVNQVVEELASREKPGTDGL